jgi:hypothetical protein
MRAGQGGPAPEISRLGRSNNCSSLIYNQGQVRIELTSRSWLNARIIGDFLSPSDCPR